LIRGRLPGIVAFPGPRRDSFGKRRGVETDTLTNFSAPSEEVTVFFMGAIQRAVSLSDNSIYSYEVGCV
jgi:hypothetical protein